MMQAKTSTVRIYILKLFERIMKQELIFVFIKKYNFI